ncbi:MAG: GspE/PulE family protein [Halanaerobiales bacterium]
MSLEQYLLKNNYISPEKLEKAKNDIKKNKNRELSLEEYLVENKYISREILMEAKEIELGVPRFNKNNFKLDKDLANFLPENFAYKNQIVPLYKEGEYLKLGMVNPSDLILIDMVEKITELIVIPYLIDENLVVELLSEIYAIDNKNEIFTKLKEDKDITYSQKNNAVLNKIQKAPIVRLTKIILKEAISKQASDIHIEPQEKDIRVRFRVDGVLFTAMVIPLSSHNSLISRFKIMADLDITEQRLPQDGRLEQKIKGNIFDMRVSTIPTILGEKMVIRILNKDDSLLDINKIGFSKNNEKMYRKLINGSKGIVLLTGPTGSGKTTTLFAAINELKSEEKNIVTIEDPVEYRLTGVNQIQTRFKIGLDFSNTMRAILRQDPDIIMLGEIRDAETAQIAIRAALTGHLVLSTLHTNDAISSIVRLLDMGIPPYLVSSAIKGVVAQRLVRKICSECKVKVKNEIKEMEFLEDKNDKIYFQGRGCKYCNNTGFNGRMAIHEVLVLNKKIRKMIVQQKSEEELYEYAKRAGMVALEVDGLKKAEKGYTTLQEIIRVTN